MTKSDDAENLSDWSRHHRSSQREGDDIVPIDAFDPLQELGTGIPPYPVASDEDVPHEDPAQKRFPEWF